MAVASVFTFTFPDEVAQEGFDVARAIGADMPATEGYLGHQVLRDVEDDGHVLVITRWGEQAQADAVLSEYVKTEKVRRATDLMGHAPSGFVGVVID